MKIMKLKENLDNLGVITFSIMWSKHVKRRKWILFRKISRKDGVIYIDKFLQFYWIYHGKSDLETKIMELKEILDKLDVITFSTIWSNMWKERKRVLFRKVSRKIDVICTKKFLQLYWICHEKSNLEMKVMELKEKLDRLRAIRNVIKHAKRRQLHKAYRYTTMIVFFDSNFSGGAHSNLSTSRSHGPWAHNNRLRIWKLVCTTQTLYRYLKF